MMFLSGAFALLLFCFLLGMVWRNEFAHEPALVAWSLFIKSLYLSWFVILFVFHFDAGTLMAWLTPAAVLGLSLLWITQPEWRPKPSGTPATHSPMPLRIAAIAIILAIATPFLMEGFGTIFRDWDALVSWNRWGIEMARGEYNPIAAAYPVLYPGLWALVYFSQGTADNWIIAKTSLWIAPTLLVLFAVNMAQRGRSLFALTATIVTAMLLFRDFVPGRVYLTNGYMDWPVAMFCLASAGLLIRACMAFDQQEETAPELLTFAIITSALAAITKQPGVLALGCSLAMTILLTLTRKLPVKRSALLIIIAITPVITFLAFYTAHAEAPVMGNIELLTELSEKERGENRIYASYKLLFGPYTKLGNALLLIAALCGIALSRGWARISVIVITTAAIAGFFIFADCCSYNRRNGIWVIGLLTPVILTGLFALWERFGKPRLSTSMQPANVTVENATSGWRFLPAYMIAVVAVLSFQFSDKTMAKRQHTQQTQLASESFNRFHNLHKSEFNAAEHVISYYTIMRFLPGYRNRHVYCHLENLECVRDRLQKHGSKTYIFYHKGMTGKKIRAEYDALVDEGLVVVAAEDQHFQLLKFAD